MSLGMSISKTPLDQQEYSPLSPPSKQCIQCIVYVGMTRKHCLLFFIFLICALTYLTSLLSGFATKPPPPLPSHRTSSNLLPNATTSKSLDSFHAATNKHRHVIPDVDLRPIPPQQFIPTLKNPCWFEDGNSMTTMTLDPYKGNPYKQDAQTRISLNHMIRLRSKNENVNADGSAATYPRRLRCMPYFYIAGMPRCGTTDLFTRLIRLPEVLAGIKEPHWWTQIRFGEFHKNFQLTELINRANFNDYLDLFDESAEKIGRKEGRDDDKDVEIQSQKIIVDASPSLLWDNIGWINYTNWKLKTENEGDGVKMLGKETLPPLIASHVRHLNPKAKFIVMLRDPVERLFSEYLSFIQKKKTIDNFHKFVIKSIDTFRNCTMTRNLRSCVYAPEVYMNQGGQLHLGIYSVFLRDWFNQFPRNQILIIFLEDYAANTNKTLEKIFRFLGITSRGVVVQNWRIRNKHYLHIGPMRNDTRLILKEFYAEFNADLAMLMGDNSGKY